MAYAAGQSQKVTLGTTAIVGMGNWKLDGISVDLLESTCFGDTAKKFMTGMMDYGTVSFSGLFDVSNALTGQSALISALANNSKIQNIRLYVDAVSYYAPNVTVASGGLVAAGLYVTSCTIGADKNGLATIEFTGKFTGPVCII